jgi:hypothetical protein
MRNHHLLATTDVETWALGSADRTSGEVEERGRLKAEG